MGKNCAKYKENEKKGRKEAEIIKGSPGHRDQRGQRHKCARKWKFKRVTFVN